MIRIIVINLLLLLLPTVIYFSYIYLRRQQTPDAELMADAPIFWLLAMGAVMSLLVLIFFVDWTGNTPGGRYVAPRYEDGVIIPGHIEPNAPAE
jgi:hypothetical protein